MANTMRPTDPAPGNIARPEMGAIQELEALLRAAGSLPAGQSLPVAAIDPAVESMGAIRSQNGVYIENGAVVAITARYGALSALPESLGTLSNLQQLDLARNRLAGLPAS